MTSADLASSFFDEMGDRLTGAVKKMRELCELRGCPLTDEQEFILCSLPLYALLGFTETAEVMVDAYDVIQRVLPDLPAWPSEDALQEWLRDPKTTGRMQ